MNETNHFLLVTLDGGGNLPPVFGLAARLKARGHRITVLTEPCLEKAVRSAGFEFRPFGSYFTRTDRSEDLFRDWKASPLSNPTLDNVVFGPAGVVARETAAALAETRAGVLLADCLLPMALIASEAAHVPSALLFHMPEYMPGPNRPPGNLGLLPGRSAAGKLRDRALGRVFRLLLSKYKRDMNRVRAGFGLKALDSPADLMNRAGLRLIQTLRSFDFPLEPAPANVRYTGPVLDDPDWTGEWANPWPEGDSRPLVVVSLSSTFQNQQAAVQRAMDALGRLDVRGLVTLGPAMTVESFSAPENVVVVASAPHSQVFPLAAAVVTHAGHGTVMRALQHGLPLVCLPMGRDQNDNAAKVAHHGCGVKLSRRAAAGQIERAVNQVLTRPLYRKKAQEFRREIEASLSGSLGVEALEELARTPVANTV